MFVNKKHLLQIKVFNESYDNTLSIPIWKLICFYNSKQSGMLNLCGKPFFYSPLTTRCLPGKFMVTQESKYNETMAKIQGIHLVTIW